jgi:hypothetical protein
MASQLRDITGFRGEKLAELALTDYSEFPKPLFRPGFLGDKWPVIDFFVELTSVRGKRPYFFVQTKSTSVESALAGKNISISTTKRDIQRLLQIPGPTYFIGVHEPTKRVFIRSVHEGLPAKSITRIPLAYELSSANLQKLHAEVRDFWQDNAHKPTTSSFL